MGIFSIFSGLGQDAYNGLNWFYSHTIGAASNWFNGIALSAEEIFVEGLVSSAISVFGMILSVINGLFSGFFASMVGISAYLGIWGLPIVIFIITGVVMVSFLLIKTILDLL